MNFLAREVLKVPVSAVFTVSPSQAGFYPLITTGETVKQESKTVTETVGNPIKPGLRHLRRLRRCPSKLLPQPRFLGSPSGWLRQ